MEATQNTITEPEKQALTTIDNEDKTTIQPKDVCHLSIILIQEFADLKSKEEEYKKMLETDIEENKDEQDDADERSIFVKNVDYSAEPAELKDHFKECGEVKRVTIPVDKITNQPKGHAFLEFATQEGAMKAKRLTDSLFKGRQITVIPKRKNVPGRGRAIRGGKNPMMQLVGMLQMVMGRGQRGRGRGGFRPY